MPHLLLATKSPFSAKIMMGFSAELVQCTQSLLGSNCAHIVLMFSLTVVNISGITCSMDKTSLAVVASMAGSAAEKVYADAEIRWCSTMASEPAQKPPPAHKGPAKEPTIMSTSAASTFWCSVMPRPVLPKTPKDQVSSRISRNLYCRPSAICHVGINKGTEWIYVGPTHDLGQINHISHILEQTFRNYKSPR